MSFHHAPIDAVASGNKITVHASVGTDPGHEKQNQQGVHGNAANHSPSQGEANRLLVR